jgi:hypothetical protein
MRSITAVAQAHLHVPDESGISIPENPFDSIKIQRIPALLRRYRRKASFSAPFN